jgi:hypothetical protein
MSDTLQPPPSAEAPTDEQALDAAPTETADPEPVRVPILSAAPNATPAGPPAEQRLPAPVTPPQHNYPQPYPQPYPPQRPQAAPPVPYAPQAVAVAEAPSAPKPDLYAPPPPKPQSRFWKAVKWPIRQAIKGVYLLFSAAGRHKVATAIILGTLLLFTTGGVVLYRALHPDNIDAHITTQANLPPLPTSIKHFIDGYYTYNGQEVWDSYSDQKQLQDAQQGGSASAIQSGLSQAKDQGVSFKDFLYAGGYSGSDGIGHYMIEATLSNGTQSAVHNWYFITDPSGKILEFVNATPQSSAPAQ